MGSYASPVDRLTRLSSESSTFRRCRCCEPVSGALLLLLRDRVQCLLHAPPVLLPLALLKRLYMMRTLRALDSSSGTAIWSVRLAARALAALWMILERDRRGVSG